MTTYDITLHSPMGPRRGALTLPPGGGPAPVTLLGRESCLTAEETAPGFCRLTGELNSVMGPIAFFAELEVKEGTFDCAARTGKGEMRLTGVRKERSETI